MLHLLVNSEQPFLTFIYLIRGDISIITPLKTGVFSLTRFLEVPSYNIFFNVLNNMQLSIDVQLYTHILL